MAFRSPNYTQAPNDLFDEMLPKMGEAELKVTLVAIRNTFGFHREKFRLSLTAMQKATGLSRQGVVIGATAAEDRGTLTRTQDGGVTEWVVNVLDQGGQRTRSALINVLDQGGQRSRPPSNKERSKERRGKKTKHSPPTPEEFSKHLEARRSK